MKITFVTVSTPAVRHLADAGRRIERAAPGALDLKIYFATREFDKAKSARLSADIAVADLTFLDLMGSPPGIIDAVYSGLEQSTGDVIPYGNSAREYFRLGAFNAQMMQGASGEGGGMAMMARMREMSSGIMLAQMREMTAEQAAAAGMPPFVRDMLNYSAANLYFRVADRENIYNLLLTLLGEYGQLPAALAEALPVPKPPREVPDIAYCDPHDMTVYPDFSTFIEKFPIDAAAPLIVLLFYGHSYPSDTSQCVARVQDRLARLGGVVPIAIGNVSVENIGLLEQMLGDLPQRPDVILNFMSFRLSAGPMGGDAEAGVDMLSAIDAPYLHPFFMTRSSLNNWRESIQGCSPSEVLISVLLPELDGSALAMPVGAASEPGYDADFDTTIEELELIGERVEHLARRVEGLLALRRKANQDKHVAIICYNYPPGEDNLFGGAFLDTFESVAAILARLADEGYDAPRLAAADLQAIFTKGGAVNSGRYGDPWEGMIHLPASACDADPGANAAWGPPPGEIMAEGGDYLIPGIVSGNVFIGLQPARGAEAGAETSYHDQTLAPHHQYLAFYQYLADQFAADALIHVGTHGTLEFLAGKECGMSEDCYPDKLLHDTPHVYLYFCGNPSEATIARRRSHAMLVGYQPPVFVPGGLYGDYLALSTELDSYRQSLALSPAAAQETYERIMRLAQELDLPADIDHVEKELYRMGSSLIPRGLHVFGEGYTVAEREDYARGLARYARDGLPALPDLAAELLAAKAGGGAAGGAETGGSVVADGAAADGAALWEADRLFDDYLRRWAEGTVGSAQVDAADAMADGVDATATDGEPAALDPAAAADAVMASALAIAERAADSREMDGLIHILNGGYNPAKLAGDIYRSPEVLPTGYNLYQFDPRLIPSSSAMERGRRVAENTLEHCLAETGEYPQSVAVILWGLETSRTQGETIGQILAYLGVRVAESSSTWDLRLEVIPREQLGRPRIDVTVNICGFFRDMFSNLIEKLDDVFYQVAALEEPDNQVFLHAQRLYVSLLAQGHDEEEARQLAAARLFGPREGEYGTGLTRIVGDKAWESEEDLGRGFIASLRHVYSRRLRGRDVPGLYEDNLSTVDIVSQIRNSHEYEITDLDHYYEFFGGLAKSVELVRGRRVQMLVTDTTGERIETDDAKAAIARGIRARVLNPKWIDGMLEHSYHGAQKIAERFENLMGLAATTGAVESRLIDDLDERYVADEEMRRRMAENNPYAYMGILEQLLEYSQRGYWDATPEQLERLHQVYLEIENSVE